MLRDIMAKFRRADGPRKPGKGRNGSGRGKPESRRKTIGYFLGTSGTDPIKIRNLVMFHLLSEGKTHRVPAVRNFFVAFENAIKRTRTALAFEKIYLR